MFIKAAALLSAPLLAAAASDVVSDRIQRRAALLELLRHDHSTRQSENYGTPDICTATPGENQASFSTVSPGLSLAAPLFTFEYSGADADCLNLASCQNACIVDAAECLGIYFNTGSCTLLGTGYGGAAISEVPATGTLALLANAGTTSASSGASSGETVPTCATFGTLDTQAENGRCECGTGRHPASAFTCEADPVPAGFINPAQPIIPSIPAPINVISPITWSVPETAVPAVMTAEQCGTICAADPVCEAFLVDVGVNLSECFKIAGSNVYPSPAGFPITVSSSRKVRRQAATGVSGRIGVPGDAFGIADGSDLVTDAYAAATGGARMRVRRAHQSQAQW